MNKYGLHGKLSAKAGECDKLSMILLEASKTVSKSVGCQVYIISKDVTDPDSIWITEVWDSKEQHDNSLQNEDVRALIMQAIPLLDEQPVKGQELEILGGKGIH